MQGIGIVFNIDELGNSGYGDKAWRIFMRILRPENIAGCMLKEGDTLQTLNGNQREFCIAVFGLLLDDEVVRRAFEKCSDKGLAPSARRFITSPDSEPLVNAGSIDLLGRLVEDEWSRISHDRCKDCGWGFAPKNVPDDLGPDLEQELENLRSKTVESAREPVEERERKQEEADRKLKRKKSLSIKEMLKPGMSVSEVIGLVSKIQDDDLSEDTLLKTVTTDPGLNDLLKVIQALKHFYDTGEEDQALSMMHGIEACELLIEILNLQKHKYRSSAACVLGHLGDKRAVEPLTQVLKHSTDDEDLREDAASALGAIGDKSGIEALIDALNNDPSTSVRWRAADSLGMIGEPSPRVIKSLARAIRNRDYGVRAYAAMSLGKFGDKRAVNPIIEWFNKLCREEFTGHRHSRSLVNNFVNVTERLLDIGGKKGIRVVLYACKNNPYVREVLTKAFENNARMAIFDSTKRRNGNVVFNLQAETPRCTRCDQKLEFLGDPRSMSNPLSSILGSNPMMKALEQWRGNVCVDCGLIFCPSCITVGAPTPCPRCKKPTLPATRMYVEEALKLHIY